MLVLPLAWGPQLRRSDLHLRKNMRTWSKWAINVVKKLPTFVDGQVALLADAVRSRRMQEGVD